jgi:hypothetical protein
MERMGRVGLELASRTKAARADCEAFPHARIGAALTDAMRLRPSARGKLPILSSKVILALLTRVSMFPRCRVVRNS